MDYFLYSFKVKLKFPNILTKGGIRQANPRNIYCCLPRLLCQYLKKSGILLNYTGLKSKAMSETIFILHIPILNIIYKN